MRLIRLLKAGGEIESPRCEWVNVLAGIALILAIFVPLPAEGQAKGGILQIGISNDPRGFDAIKAGFFDRRSEIIAPLIMETLVKLAPDGSFAPLLATDWQVTDDNLIWTFRLRRDVKFHDGSVFTAEDVAAHFSRLMNPDSRFGLASLLEGIRRVDALDSHTVRFELKRPAPLLAMLSVPNTIQLMPPTAYVATGKHNLLPVGTGPYRLDSWTNGDSITLTRHTGYWNSGKGHVDKVRFRVLPQDVSRFAALRAGEIDLTELHAPETIKNASTAEGLTKRRYLGSGGLFLVLNTRNEHLKHRKVRAAIAHAFDQQTFVRVGWGNTRPVIQHLLGSKAQCGDIDYREHDPDLAKRLLREYGKPVRLRFVTSNAYPKQSAIIQAMLKAVGITLDLDVVDRNTKARRLRSRQFDLIGWGTRSSPDMAGQLVLYSHSRAGQNPAGFSDPDMDKLLETMRATLDPKKRIALQCEVSRRMNQSAHLVYAGGWQFDVFARERVQGLDFHHGHVDASAIWLRKEK